MTYGENFTIRSCLRRAGPADRWSIVRKTAQRSNSIAARTYTTLIHPDILASLQKIMTAISAASTIRPTKTIRTIRSGHAMPNHTQG